MVIVTDNVMVNVIVNVMVNVMVNVWNKSIGQAKQIHRVAVE